MPRLWLHFVLIWFTSLHLTFKCQSWVSTSDVCSRFKRFAFRLNSGCIGFIFHSVQVVTFPRLIRFFLFVYAWKSLFIFPNMGRYSRAWRFEKGLWRIERRGGYCHQCVLCDFHLSISCGTCSLNTWSVCLIQHHSFYDFIVTKARGKSGEWTPTAFSPSNTSICFYILHLKTHK